MTVWLPDVDLQPLSEKHLLCQNGPNLGRVFSSVVRQLRGAAGRSPSGRACWGGIPRSERVFWRGPQGFAHTGRFRVCEANPEPSVTRVWRRTKGLTTPCRLLRA